MDSGLDREDFVRCVECVRSGGDFVVENRIEVISANVGPNRAMGSTSGDIVFVVENLDIASVETAYLNEDPNTFFW